MENVLVFKEHTEIFRGEGRREVHWGTEGSPGSVPPGGDPSVGQQRSWGLVGGAGWTLSCEIPYEEAKKPSWSGGEEMPSNPQLRFLRRAGSRDSSLLSWQREAPAGAGWRTLRFIFCLINLY